MRITATLLIAALVPGLWAENWGQWRGLAHNGSTSETGLPAALDASTQLWAIDLPGSGSGTPAVWGDKIFVSAVNAKTAALTCLCFARADGKPLWSAEVGIAGGNKKATSDLAGPSPICDGTSVFFYFGNGELAAFSLDGKELWKRNIAKDHGAFNVLHLYASSPLLHEGTLYVQVLHRDTPIGAGGSTNAPSYLLGIDPATGKDRFKQLRPAPAAAESLESYATPIPTSAGGKPEILVVGGDCITGHDPASGVERWRCAGWNPDRINHWRLVPSTVVIGDLAIVCPPKGGKVFAVKLGGSGDVTTTGVAWKATDLSSDVCTPLVLGGKLIIADPDKKTVSCADPATGKRLWMTELGGGAVLRGSPTGGDGHIYQTNQAGDAWVIAAADGKILNKANLGGNPTRASVALAYGTAFVRTGNKLLAFGKK